MYWYAIVPTYSEEIGYRRNVFGPYTSWEQAQDVVDKMDISPELVDIIELPTRDRREAISILEKANSEGGE